MEKMFINTGKERHEFWKSQKEKPTGSLGLVLLDSHKSWTPKQPLGKSGQPLDKSWTPEQPLDSSGQVFTGPSRPGQVWTSLDSLDKPGQVWTGSDRFG